MARPAASVAPTSALKRLLVGRAVSSARLEHTLLPKVLALPVFSSDALSSVAYASEEILRVLLIASVASAGLVFGVSIAISLLMAIVVLSYRQTIRAYPSGGGAYIVSKENLGTLPGLIAASALLVDYMLTVVVSTVAGVVAIYSAIPELHPYAVELAVGFVLLIMLANLRGVKEAGVLFAVPTYFFVASILGLVAVGLLRCVSGCPTAHLPAGIEPAQALAVATSTIGFSTLLRAFSSGATALTGVEAISNGVPAFKRPQAKNAAATLAIMGALAITMFTGLSYLASHVPGVTVSDERSVVAQLGSAVFGEGSVWFYVVQTFTAAILVLAANTAFQDFPRLSSILARDRFLPSQFRNRGDRLVFSNGVIGLALGAVVVIIAFDADLTALIHLYVVGVFTSFTLSQSGMVRHWWRERGRDRDAARGWRVSMAVNAVGAVTTAVVLAVVVRTKFLDGAWLSILVMVLLVPVFLSIHRHYASVASQLSRSEGDVGAPERNHVVLLVRSLGPATAEALGYVRSFRPRDLLAVTPADAPADLPARWPAFAGEGTLLRRLPSAPLLEAVRTYVRSIPRGPRDAVTVVVPEDVEGGLLSYILRRRDLFRLKAGLLRETGVVITDVPSIRAAAPASLDRRMVPYRTVTLVFLSAVHGASMRAVNYATSLGAAETRAVYFDMDPDIAHRLEVSWFDANVDIPLDIVEAPFRDLTAPILQEIRRYTQRSDTIVNVVIPEVVVRKWRHLLLHNQSALFIKRLLLFEERAILTSVPFPLEVGRLGTPAMIPAT